MSATAESSPVLSALLTFTAQNVRSFWDEVGLSLLGTRLSEAGVARSLKSAGSPSAVSVLPAAGIFGANASGKSTVLRAMADMRAVVLGSFRHGDRETRIHRRPFLLHNEGAERPSRFAVDLILDGVRWQYGFEIDDHQVLGEYAYYYPRGRQSLVFFRDREHQKLSFGPPFRAAGRTLARLVRKNALLLSVAGAAADAPSDEPPGLSSLIGRLFAWFRTSFRLMESANREPRITTTANRVQSGKERAIVLALLRAADLGITDIERFQPDLDPKAAELLQRAFRIINGLEDAPGSGQEDRIVLGELVKLNHMGRDGPVLIDPEHESQGTLVWISLVGPVLDALDTGAVVLADELDASLHPHLVQKLVNLFQERVSNPRCAQLIFNAHDVTILGDSGQRALGRDQIWFTEKDAHGKTTLYPLADFRPKGDEAIRRRYLQGRYGGIPLLDPAEFRQIVPLTRSES